MLYYSLKAKMDDFKSFSSSSFKSKPKKTQRPQNFIEALKDLSSSVKTQTKDATLGVGRGVVDQLFGATGDSAAKPADNQANKPFSFEEFLRSREQQVETITKQRYEKKIQDERLLFTHKEQENKMQIKAIQEELKKLAAATNNLSQEVRKAVSANFVEVGAYHKNFLDHIRSIIEFASQEVANSTTWLKNCHKRKKQQGLMYWAQVKKSGTRYMLSSERYMATQAG